VLCVNRFEPSTTSNHGWCGAEAALLYWSVSALAYVWASLALTLFLLLVLDWRGTYPSILTFKFSGQQLTDSILTDDYQGQCFNTTRYRPISSPSDFQLSRSLSCGRRRALGRCFNSHGNFDSQCDPYCLLTNSVKRCWFNSDTTSIPLFWLWIITTVVIVIISLGCSLYKLIKVFELLSSIIRSFEVMNTSIVL